MGKACGVSVRDRGGITYFRVSVCFLHRLMSVLYLLTPFFCLRGRGREVAVRK